MSKEIKFRSWDFTQNKMREVTDLMFTVINSPVVSYDDGDNYTDDIELMQFTGLHDKNGKEEYHEDIVKSNLCNSIGVIKWDDKVGSWYYQWQDGKKTYPREYYDVLDEEVIGNIYANPNLLKEDKKCNMKEK
jgi:uncharacterized phage protein (TIGR01671 family)